jgi:hypothetical protein
MILDEVASVRTGDKGDDLIIAVLPRDADDYDRVRARVTAERVAEHYGLAEDAVHCTPMPTVTALVFHLRGVLGGGVTGSSYLDGHGKTMGYHLLTLPID